MAAPFPGLTAILENCCAAAAQPAPYQAPRPSWQRAVRPGWRRLHRPVTPATWMTAPTYGIAPGGFGAGCFGRAPDGQVNLFGNPSMAGEQLVRSSCRNCQFALFRKRTGKPPAAPTPGQPPLARGPIPVRFDSSQEPGEPPLGAWPVVPRQQPLSRAPAPMPPATPELGRAQRCVSKRRWAVKAFQSESCRVITQRSSLPGGGVPLAVGQIPPPPLDLSAAARAGATAWAGSANTDPSSASVPSAMTAAPEHTLPGRRIAAARAAQPSALIQAPSRVCCWMGRRQAAVGGGRRPKFGVPGGCPPTLPGVEVLRLAAAGIPVAMAAEIWEALRPRWLDSSQRQRPAQQRRRAGQRRRCPALPAGERALRSKLPLGDQLGPAPLTAFANRPGGPLSGRYTDPLRPPVATNAWRSPPRPCRLAQLAPAEIDAWQQPVLSAATCPRGLRMAPLQTSSTTSPAEGSLWTRRGSGGPWVRFGCSSACGLRLVRKPRTCALYGSFAPAAALA